MPPPEDQSGGGVSNQEEYALRVWDRLRLAVKRYPAEATKVGLGGLSVAWAGAGGAFEVTRGSLTASRASSSATRAESSAHRAHFPRRDSRCSAISSADRTGSVARSTPAAIATALSEAASRPRPGGYPRRKSTTARSLAWDSAAMWSRTPKSVRACSAVMG